MVERKADLDMFSSRDSDDAPLDELKGQKTYSLFNRFFSGVLCAPVIACSAAPQISPNPQDLKPDFPQKSTGPAAYLEQGSIVRCDTEACYEVGSGGAICQITQTAFEISVGLRNALSLSPSEDGCRWELKLSKGGILPFSFFKDLPDDDTAVGKSPEKKYFDYVSEKISTPEDIALLISENVEWRADPDQRLYSSEETLASGFGDCDNKAWLAKELLDDLGERIGHDFEARVVALIPHDKTSGHAVTVYKNIDGKMYAMDDGLINPLGEGDDFDVANGSSHFPELLANGATVFCVFRLDIGSSNRGLYLLDENLKPCFIKLGLLLEDSNLMKDFDPDKILPSDWRKYENITIYFGKRTDKNDFDKSISYSIKDGFPIFREIYYSEEYVIRTFFRPGTDMPEKMIFFDGYDERVTEFDNKGNVVFHDVVSEEK